MTIKWTKLDPRMYELIDYVDPMRLMKTEEIAKCAGMKTAVVRRLLLKMEKKGMVVKFVRTPWNGMYYCRTFMWTTK